jgi:hypothetical protein
MNTTFNEHDLVALLDDVPDERLVAGDIGTIVFVHNEGKAFEVEFPNPAGKPRYVVVTVPRDNLLKLRNVDVNLRSAG